MRSIVLPKSLFRLPDTRPGWSEVYRCCCPRVDVPIWTKVALSMERRYHTPRPLRSSFVMLFVACPPRPVPSRFFFLLSFPLCAPGGARIGLGFTTRSPPSTSGEGSSTGGSMTRKEGRRPRCAPFSGARSRARRRRTRRKPKRSCKSAGRNRRVGGGAREDGRGGGQGVVRSGCGFPRRADSCTRRGIMMCHRRVYRPSVRGGEGLWGTASTAVRVGVESCRAMPYRVVCR